MMPIQISFLILIAEYSGFSKIWFVPEFYLKVSQKSQTVKLVTRVHVHWWLQVKIASFCGILTCSFQNTPYWPLLYLNFDMRMSFGSCKSKNIRKIKFNSQLAKVVCIHLVNWFFVLTLLNTFWISYWNKWYLIWKPEY